MDIKTFRAKTMQDALALVRAHVVMPGPKLRLFEEER